MKFATLTAILTLSVGAYALQETATQEPSMQPAAQSEHHAWLQQLVGDWTGVAEATMGPGTEPMRFECTQHVRSLGGLWILAEGAATMQGTPFATLMTLGYDPRQQKFIGSWVDSMQTHMWSYKGTLDDKKTTLPLETEGPDFGDPTKNARYRDVIEVKSKDKWLLSSSVHDAEGKWTTFMTVEYNRKAAGTAK
jgi:hypothetical protein